MLVFVPPLSLDDAARYLDLADRAARLHEQPGATESLRVGLRAYMTYVGDVLVRAVSASGCAERAAPVAAVAPEAGAEPADNPGIELAAEVSVEPKVGDVLRRWADVPPGSLSRDVEGDVVHKRTDGKWCWWWPQTSGTFRTAHTHATDTPGCEPWTILALRVSDDVTGDEVARLVGNVT